MLRRLAPHAVADPARLIVENQLLVGVHQAHIACPADLQRPVRKLAGLGDPRRISGGQHGENYAHGELLAAGLGADAEHGPRYRALG